MFTSRLSTIGALAAAVTVMAFSAAPANAAIGSVSGSLSVLNWQTSDPCGDARYKWRVQGYVAMTYAEAQAIVYNSYPYQILVRLWGEDPYSDDKLAEKYVSAGQTRASYRGLEFDTYGTTSTMVLNEDPERPWGEDELYAGIRFLKNGVTLRSVETNRVYREFWHGDCY